MTPNDLDKLPTDVLSNLMSTMTIEAISKLKEAVTCDDEPTPIELECNRAMSVSRYLKDTLGHGKELLIILSKCFAYIGGSRSLEFFVPGCIDETSDLDIYVPNMTNMGKAMRMLHGLGVEWLDLEYDVRACAEKGEGDVLIPGNSLLSLRSSGTLQKICGDLSIELDDWANIHSADMMIVSVSNNTMSTRYAPPNAGHSTPEVIGIINGTLLHKGKKIRVQLISETRFSGLSGIDGLSRYHSSCVQSFISGHMACHLHGKMASDKLTYGWYQNANDINYLIGRRHNRNIGDIKNHGVTYTVPAWLKYQRRGFKYVQPPGGSLEIRRTLFDSDCTTIEYFNDIGAPTIVSAGYQLTMQNTWWYQNCVNTGGVWVDGDIEDESSEFLNHPWFSSDNIHMDMWYLRRYHVTEPSLILDDTEIVPEVL